MKASKPSAYAASKRERLSLDRRREADGVVGLMTSEVPRAMAKSRPPPKFRCRHEGGESRVDGSLRETY
jgi:hypothetical protein